MIYLGAGGLAWTAAKMMVSEPFYKAWLASQSTGLEYVIQVVVVLGVLMIAYISSERMVDVTPSR